MSFKNYKKSIILNFNYDEVKKGVPEANKQMALLNSELRRQMEEARQAGSTIEKLRISHDGLSNKLKIQSDLVDSLKKELDSLTNSEEKNNRAILEKTIELNNAETQLLRYQKASDKVSKELESQENVIIRAGTAISDYAKNAKEAGIDIEKLAGTMQKVGAVMMGVGAAAIKMRGNLDREMAKARTIADTTQISFEELRKGVLRASDDFNLPATEMADGLYNVISSNVETVKSIDMLRDSALLAKTGFTSMSNATDILTTIINSYGLEVEEAKKITDQLIITQKLGSATVGEMGESFGKVAGLAATAQIPLAELLAGIATLTTRGLEASEAVTGLRGILSAVIKPTKEARDEAERLGLKFDLAAMKSKGLAGFLEDVQKKTRGNDESMAKLFGRVEGLNSMFILTGKGAELFAKNVDEISNATGVADEALKDIQTPMERFESSLNKVKNSLSETGGELSPLLNMVTSFLEIIAKIPSKVITVIAVVGTVIFAISTAAKSVLKFSELAEGLGGVFNYTVNPKILQAVGIVMALAAAIAIVLALIVALKGNASQLTGIADSVKGVGESVAGNFQSQATAMQKQANRTIHGSHRSGLGRVPFDGYKAELHENEEVLTANDPRNRNNPNGGFGQQIVNVYVQADDLQQMTDVVKLLNDLKQTSRAGVVYG